MDPARLAIPVPGTKWAEVDIGALRGNAAALKAASPGAQVMAMVKANGYGHGALLAARAAVEGGATWLGVSSVIEALELVRADIGAHVLNVGWSRPSELVVAAEHAVHVTVWDVEGVGAAQAAAREAGRTLQVHWKLDTGMGRLGTRRGEVAAMAAALHEARADVVVAGIFTHFAHADADDAGFTEEQLERFVAMVEEVRERFPGALLHTANSPALLRFPLSHHDIVRPGIALYGYPPVPTEVMVRPAMAVRALVTQVKRVEAGETVGYGREWTAPRPSLVASVAIGYGDGVDRRNANNGVVIVGGATCAIRGRISMDQLTIDVSDAQPVAAGDVATVIGRDGDTAVGADAVASRIGTIAYEVLCAVSARVPRVVVDEEETR